MVVSSGIQSSSMSEWRRWQDSGLTLAVPPPKCHGRRRSCLAWPRAAAAIPAETAGAVCPPVSGPHHDLHAAPSVHVSLHRGHAAAVDDHSVSDLHAASSGRLASTATREVQNAPVAIVDGAGKSRCGDSNPRNSRNKNRDAGAEHLIDFAEHRRISESFLNA